MIFYIVREENHVAMKAYFETWGRALAPRVRLLFYEDLLNLAQLGAGTYIFSDLEMLSPTELRIAEEIWEQISRSRPPMRLLNHPGRALLRYALQSKFYELGKNRFRVSRASDGSTAHRFPVFLRGERDHDGAFSGLLQTRHELAEALGRAILAGRRLRDLLVVEFCDTSDATGIFRKYAAFLVGDRVVPRHLVFSREWMLKAPSLINEAVLREEQQYLEQNPHEAWIREMFRLAKIDYGRIDYGLLGSEPQVWEINTNPTVMMRPEKYHPLHLSAQQWFAAQISGAFEAVDSQSAGLDPIRVSINPAVLRSLEAESRKERRTLAFRTFLRKVAERPLFQWFAPILKSVLFRFASLLARMAGFRHQQEHHR